MDYEIKIKEILEKNLTERGYKLWTELNNRIPNIWSKTTSSTGKYHKKVDGTIPTCAEHTYEMVYACVKLLRMFNLKEKTNDADALIMAVVMHDSFKYGKDGGMKYTDKKHDKGAADIIKNNKAIFIQHFNEKQFQMLEEGVRYHSGRWSTDCDIKTFTFKDVEPESMFVHVLDMLSTAALIKTDLN